MGWNRNALIWASVAYLGTVGTAAAEGPAWPSRPIRLVIPYEAGGLADRLGRIVADKLSSRLGHRLVPENRGGSAGLIAGAIVASAPADGYTLMIGGTGPHVTGPATNHNAGYDPIRNFTHIAMIGGDVLVLASNPRHGWTSLASLTAAARAPGASLDCGSTGVATPTHLVLAQFVGNSSLDITHIPFKGAGPAMQAVLGDHTPLLVATLSSLAPHLTAGRLTPLALSAKSRHASFPEIKTFAEQGYPGITGGTQFWLAGPAGLSNDVARRLNAEVRAALRLPDVKALFAEQLLVTSDDDLESFQAYVASQVESWTAIAKSLKLNVE